MLTDVQVTSPLLNANQGSFELQRREFSRYRKLTSFEPCGSYIVAIKDGTFSKIISSGNQIANLVGFVS